MHITNELLYRLSYTGTTYKTAFCIASHSNTDLGSQK